MVSVPDAVHSVTSTACTAVLVEFPVVLLRWVVPIRYVLQKPAHSCSALLRPDRIRSRPERTTA